MNRFLLTYSPPPSEEFEKSLIAFVDNAKFVSDWTHPFVSFFMFASDWEVSLMAESFGAFFPKGMSFLLMESSGNPFEARMPVSAFDWLRDAGATLRNDRE